MWCGIIDLVMIHYRLCHLCDSNDIGDEFHYIMACNFFNNDSKIKSNTCLIILRWMQIFLNSNNSFQLITLLYKKNSLNLFR